MLKTKEIGEFAQITLTVETPIELSRGGGGRRRKSVRTFSEKSDLCKKES